MVIALAVNVISCFFLIPYLGLIGAALSNLASTVMLNLMRATEVWILMKMHAYDRGYLKPLIAAVTGSGLILLLGQFVNTDAGMAQLAILIVVLSVLYLIANIALGLEEPDKNVLNLIRKRLSRSV